MECSRRNTQAAEYITKSRSDAYYITPTTPHPRMKIWGWIWCSQKKSRSHHQDVVIQPTTPHPGPKNPGWICGFTISHSHHSKNRHAGPEKQRGCFWAQVGKANFALRAGRVPQPRNILGCVLQHRMLQCTPEGGTHHTFILAPLQGEKQKGM